MRIRGRRFTCLLASALPLLAEDPAALSSTSYSPPSSDEVGEHDTTSIGTTTLVPSHENGVASLPIIETDESQIDDDDHQITASEAIHSDESFRLPSLPRINAKSLDMVAPEAVSKTVDVREDANGSKPSKYETSMDQQGQIKERELTEDKILTSSETEEPTATMHRRIENAESYPETEEIKSEDVDEAMIETYSKGESEAVESDADGVAAPESIRKKLASEALGETETPEVLSDDQINSDSSKTSSIAETTSEVENADDLILDKEESKENGQNTTEGIVVEEDDEDELHSLSQVLVDYASKSAGALIIEKSGSFKGTSNLLNGDRDKYAIAPCEEKKFVVLSLSEDILVKQIKLANYERFSSSVKMFQVLGSQTLEKWFDMGSYEAKAGNGEQIFDLKEPAWARYLKFKFMSHHGQEYYCTFSQIKVHGSTMVQGFHEQWEGSADEEESTDSEEESIDSNFSTTQPQVDQNSSLAELIDENKQEGTSDALENSEEDNGSEIDSEESPKKDVGSPGENEDNKDKMFSRDEAAASGIKLLSPSKNLDAKLHGVLSDEELFSSLYDLIPSTLNALPATSRESPGRQTTGGKMRTLHHFTNAAVKSNHANQAPSDAEGLIADSYIGISTPRMSTLEGNTVNLYFGTKVELSMNVSDDEVDGVGENFESQESSRMDAVKKEQTIVTSEGANTPDVRSKPDDEASQEFDSKLHSVEKSEVDEETSAPESENLESADVETLDENSIDFVDTRLQKMLEGLPSANCLSNLNFGDFKSKAMAAKKPPGGAGANTASSANPMEPIFKKLTDEIRLLQSNLSIQDQFAKTSVACYQRVLLDLMLQMETLRIDHEKRIRQLEEGFQVSYQSYVKKITRSLLDALSILVAWFYSTILLFFAFMAPRVVMLCKWVVLIAKVAVRLPGIAIRRTLHYWPNVRGALMSVEMGPDAAVIIDPLIDQMDQLVVDLQQKDSLADYEELEIVGDEMWKFPMVPIVVLVLVGRLVMCFTGSSSRMNASPQQSIQDSSSPQKMLLNNSPSPRKKGVHMGSPGTQPEDSPPALIEEPPLGNRAIPRSDGNQKLVTP